MKTNKVSTLAWFLVLSLWLSGCGSGSLVVPTQTPPPANTPAPSATIPAMAAPISALTNTPIASVSNTPLPNPALTSTPNSQNPTFILGKSVDGYNAIIPSEWLASGSQTARFQLDLEQGTTSFKSCSYTNNHTLSFSGFAITATITDWKDQRALAIQTFNGKENSSSCPSEQFFTSQSANVIVSQPDQEDIKAWINEVMTPLGFSPITLAAQAATDNPVALTDGNVTGMVERKSDKVGDVAGLAWSPDGKMLAVASSTGLHLYSPQSLFDIKILYDYRELDKIAAGTYGNKAGPVTIEDWECVAFSPDGLLLAAGTKSGSVKVWKVSDLTILYSLDGHTEQVNSVAFSPDGKTLASGASDNKIRLWQVSDGSLIRILAGHTASVFSVAFSPDGQTLASGSDDVKVKIWSVPDGKVLHTLGGHKVGVTSVAFSSDGQTLATGSYDWTAKLWRMPDGVMLHSLDQGYTNMVESVAFSPDGSLLATGSSTMGNVWRVKDGQLLLTPKTAGGVWWDKGLAFSPDGSMLATGGSDGTIALWGLPNQ